MDRSIPSFRAVPTSVPFGLAAIAILAFLAWLWAPVRAPVDLRVPGTDRIGVGTESATPVDVFAAGTRTAGAGKPAPLKGSWSRFRGPEGTGIGIEATSVARTWPGGRPREIWSVEVGEGFAGPAIVDGRVFLMDYDRERQRDALRCLSLEDGLEIWRYSYPVAVKRNHGLTRTVPTVVGDRVVAMGPKCHVLCVKAGDGEFVWGIDLVKDHGATIPPWYTGQCPLVDGDRVILAPGGPEALLMAVELGTGKVVWKTPNLREWKMTHASVVPMTIGGSKFYLYCASAGVVAVRAEDGSVAWETGQWKINIATVPTPVPIDGDRYFFTGGYNAGSLLLKFSVQGGTLSAEEVFRVKADVFGATQHSPIWRNGVLYGIRADGRFVCLTPEGKVAWESGPETNFGLGPLLMARDGLIFALDDGGSLSLIEASPEAYRPLATARIMDGHECWAPLALASGRLLARDLTRMVCLQVE
ncbi:MAG: PQQ-binding-like beta-propeller repeat protein [Verrucomicrobiales bacterium]|nr:PQQ-binding-like beta-propeller repeat protein [Verrucomicrobiales bacterium]